MDDPLPAANGSSTDGLSSAYADLAAHSDSSESSGSEDDCAVDQPPDSEVGDQAGPPDTPVVDEVDDDDFDDFDDDDTEFQESLYGAWDMDIAEDDASEVEDRNMTGSPVVDITARDIAAGMDIQGIPWGEFSYSREGYRAKRLEDALARLDRDPAADPPASREVRRDARFYKFFHSTRQVQCSILHFQLRNLVWPSSNHDVYVVQNNAVVHWDAIRKTKREVLNLSGTQNHLGPVQISTMVVNEDLLVAGGFYGEVVVYGLDQDKILHSRRVTTDENAITNAVEAYRAPSGARRIMTSNNDCRVRIFEAETFDTVSTFVFNYPINHASRQPNNGKLLCIAGDDKDVLLADSDTGRSLHTLRGHSDFSFATGWHPAGHIFATGNQDRTCCVWDIRNTSTHVAVLGGHVGAIRTLRFSNDGQILAMAEPVDFVHSFDTRDFARCQEIDVFGEIAGVDFTPDASSLFIGIHDPKFGSLLEYERLSHRRVEL